MRAVWPFEQRPTCVYFLTVRVFEQQANFETIDISRVSKLAIPRPLRDFSHS